MAVEDLLDNSDLVANALAEAASVRVDQVRLATQNFRDTLIASTPSSQETTSSNNNTEGGANNKPLMPSAQGSRESQSPPNELDTLPLLASSYTRGEDADAVSPNNEDGNSINAKNSENTQQQQQVVDLKRLEQISSSMSQVLDSINLTSAGARVAGNQDNNNEEEGDHEETSYEDVVVAENNFLNDNHNVQEG